MRRPLPLHRDGHLVSTKDTVPTGPKPLDVACPRCNAAPDSKCCTATGWPSLTHVARWKAVGISKPTAEDLERDFIDQDHRTAARRSGPRAAYTPHPVALANVCQSCGRPQNTREVRCPLCKGIFVPAESCLDCSGKGIYPSGRQCTSCWNGCGLVPKGSNTGS